MNIYENIAKNKAKGKKQFAILVDPDKVKVKDLDKLVKVAAQAKADYFFIGGSLITDNKLDECLRIINKQSKIPTVLFPGSVMQVSPQAKAILLLSVISGRNAEMLIGKHVIAAPLLKSSKLEIIPTGYMLIDSGRATSVTYMSNTTPIPADKNDIAVCTAMAGEMLGLKLIYMDAGSGAKQPITEEMIRAVSKSVSVPLIIGGGISSAEKALKNCKAGADVIVVGNAIEKDYSLISEIAAAVHSA